MERDEGSGRLKTFLLGGLVGASAVLAALRKRPEAQAQRRRTGLGAFEDAPCYREHDGGEPGPGR